MIEKPGYLPEVILVASSLGVPALSVGACFILAYAPPEPGRGYATLLITALFLSWALPLVSTAFAIYKSVRYRVSRQRQLRVILLAYLSTILVFTGLYFSMDFWGDHSHAVWKFRYYESQGESLKNPAYHFRALPFTDNERAFEGIDERLWSTVDDFTPRAVLIEVPDPEAYRSRVAADFGFESVVHLRRQAIPAVLSDCLHLSIITITTVGYGNIAPRTWYSKLATDIEALSGTALLVLALGMLFSQWKEGN